MPSETAPAPAISRPAFWAGMMFALIGVANFTSWLVLGDGDGARNRAPVDFLPYYGIAVLIMALAAGMDQRSLQARPTSIERACLFVLIVAIGWGLGMNAADTSGAIDAIIIRLPHLTLAIGLYYLLSHSSGRAVVWVTAALALQTLLHMPIVAGLYIVAVDDPGINWLGGPIGYWHVRIWGVVLATGLAAVFGLYMADLRRGLPVHLLAGVVFFLLWLGLLWSGTRSGVVGIGAALLLSLVLIPRPTLVALPVFLIAGTAAAFVSLTLTLPIDAYGVLQSTGRDNGLEGMNGASGGRVRMWLATAALLAEYPIFGHGYDQFVVMGNDPRSHLHPHNAILQLLFDFGFVGGGAAILLLASLWLRAIVPVVRDRIAVKYGAMTALHALIAMSMFDGVMYHHDPLAAVAICFALLFAAPQPPTG